MGATWRPIGDRDPAPATDLLCRFVGERWSERDDNAASAGVRKRPQRRSPNKGRPEFVYERRQEKTRTQTSSIRRDCTRKL